MKDLYIINERGPDFWGTYKIADETSYAKYENREHKILKVDEFENIVDRLKGKRVLVYIHGLRNTKKELCENFDNIKNRLATLTPTQSYYAKFKNFISYYLGYSDTYQDPALYDVIIGYSWPSYDHETHYYKAKEHAKALAPKLTQHLLKLSKTASKIDIMAHSMGNLLLFEALSKQTDLKLKIDHIYSIAPAVADDSITTSGKYEKTLDLCNLLFVFHSKHDYALGWPFYFAENQTYALGLHGPNKKTEFDNHPKLKVIDSSNIIKGHSEYFYSDSFYQYLFKIQNRELSFEKSHFEIE